jgi:hypothetical protein
MMPDNAVTLAAAGAPLKVADENLGLLKPVSNPALGR